MLWNEVKTGWKDLGKKFQANWPKLTDADLKKIAGRRDELLEVLRKHYKMEKAAVEKELEEFLKTLKPIHV